MTRDLNEKLVFDTFNFEYNEERFKLFIRDLLVDADFSKEQQYKLIQSEYTDFIKSYKRICMYEYTLLLHLFQKMKTEIFPRIGDSLLFK